MNDRLYLTSALELRGDAGKIPASFSGTAYSGDFVSKYGGIVIDLATLNAEAGGQPVLADHRADSYIGTVSKVDNNGRALGVAGALFSDIDEGAKQIALKAQRGAKFQMSVGISDYSVEDLPAGKQAEVNGRNFSGPVTILRGARLDEVSIVPIGADRKTSAAFFDRKETDMDVVKLTADVARLTAQSETDRAEIARLTAALAAADAERTRLADEAAKAARDARLVAVRALFSDIGKEATDEAVAPYASMSAEAFEAVAAELRAAKKRPPASLFSRSPVSGGAAGQQGGESLLVARARAMFGAAK